MTKSGPVVVHIETRTGTIAARVWTLAVGRSTLLLLDSNVAGNQPEDRELTARLYGGDSRVRIRQELLLGVGGVRALAALGISPGVVHLNEGHSAFAVLELVRRRMELEGIDAKEAIRRVSSRIVFTTHTPVPAGHDRFPAALVEEHLGPLRESHRARASRVHGPRSGGGRRRGRGVLHDGAGAEDVPARQCGVVAAWRGLSRDVDRVVSGRLARTQRADRPHHQRHSRPDLAGAADATGLQPPSRSRLAVTRRRTGLLGNDRAGGRCGDLGNASDAESAVDCVRATAGRAACGGAEREPGGDRPAAPRAQSGRVDDWVCAPVCDLQTRQSDSRRSRSDRLAREPSAMAGADHFCRQVASARSARQTHPATGRAADARPALLRQAAVHRRLRHHRRPLPRARRRFVDQQPAPSARSLRHQRSESRPERRLESAR